MNPQSGGIAKARVLVLSTPDAPELKVLEKVPGGAQIIGVGRALSDLEGLPNHKHAAPQQLWKWSTEHLGAIYHFVRQ